MIKVNKARCNGCGDVIESTHVHDYKHCKCGAVFVDGGTKYLRRGWNPESTGYTDLSTFYTPHEIAEMLRDIGSVLTPPVDEGRRNHILWGAAEELERLQDASSDTQAPLVGQEGADASNGGDPTRTEDGSQEAGTDTGA